MAYSDHPRPQLERTDWVSLDGPWNFAFDDKALWHGPSEPDFALTINVPYVPEAPRSGLHDEAFHPVVWYRRTVELPEGLALDDAHDVILHFGAIDYESDIWINGQHAAHHVGGHTPVRVGLRAYGAGPDFEIVVRAADDPLDMHKPRGKQDWLREPHGIWYPRTTGIWQSVWLERVGISHIDRLHWTPDFARFEIRLDARIARPHGHKLRVTLSHAGTMLVADEYALTGKDTGRVIALPDPGIDDARADFVWSPEHPRLLDAEIELIDADGAVVDSVRSYTALRTVGIANGRFILNARDYFLRLVLDQGYWREGVMTASDEELRRDVELTKSLGFNGVRKHQKIENPRFLYWADVLGLLVWEEMPSAYAYSNEAVTRLAAEWQEAIERDYSHPSIVAWVPFNESWGIPELPRVAVQRSYQQALYHLTKTLDPSRPVSGNDGWEQIATDIFAVHDYHPSGDVLDGRYRDETVFRNTLKTFRSAGRVLEIDGHPWAGQPVMVTEFGGIAYFLDQTAGWGYSQAKDAEDFLERYADVLRGVTDSVFIAGYCYTQLTDTYQEQNGVLTMDRTPKADVARIRAANLGVPLEQLPADPLGYNARWLKNQAPRKP
ncbi:glycoside hydrolase family 2 [Kaistia dalseonensis]|uniref:Beta-galactosidase/beta-glucuronidase n=1 Tax=Kaistia dalseonensis TaxID=410840 RepID=A0ABU0H2N8_9HYPH|nr:glycoside hydrolase family 2 TIM barrel-domain containing protein [Kaistia dalseonensis]MCX5493990.1 glycoside hydrolase family 2 [Kaistia dalseonensis]MDQ0436566.1 beta-galactosidase/beta-glucuronidase [Kaistia dalseonensis]